MCERNLPSTRRTAANERLLAVATSAEIWRRTVRYVATQVEEMTRMSARMSDARDTIETVEKLVSNGDAFRSFNHIHLK